MMQRPLPIRGLPLAPAISGLTVMEDVVHATSSHPRRPIAPLPFTRPAAAVPVTPTAPAAAPELNTPTPASRPPRWQPQAHYRNPPQHRTRPREQALPAAATTATTTSTAPAATISPTRPIAAPAAPAVTAPAPATAIAAMAAKIAAAARATAHPGTSVTASASATADIARTLFPARRYRKTIPDFVPIRPEAFASHHHPLAVRSLVDLVRFFPFPIGASAVLAALSGFLAGGIANRALGGDLPPLYFVAGYLALYLLNLLTHYFGAKGQLFFSNRRRFLHLLAANALILLPHFIAYSILTGMEK